MKLYLKQAIEHGTLGGIVENVRPQGTEFVMCDRRLEENKYLKIECGSSGLRGKTFVCDGIAGGDVSYTP